MDEKLYSYYGQPFDEAKAKAEIDRLRAENGRLRKGIRDYLTGNFDGPPARKVDQCPHGKFQWEVCEACIDAHFRKVLDPEALPDGSLSKIDSASQSGSGQH